jgi:hypothetical protein
VLFAAACDVPGTRPAVVLFAGVFAAGVADLAALAFAAAAEAPGARPAVLDLAAVPVLDVEDALPPVLLLLRLAPELEVLAVEEVGPDERGATI